MYETKEEKKKKTTKRNDRMKGRNAAKVTRKIRERSRKARRQGALETTFSSGKMGERLKRKAHENAVVAQRGGPFAGFDVVAILFWWDVPWKARPCRFCP